MPASQPALSGLSLRPSRLPDDLTSMADAMTAAAPRFPVTPELLRVWHETNDPALQVVVRVAELEGAVVGVGRTIQQDAGQQQNYWVNLWVAGPWQQRGVGRALLQKLEQEVLALGGRSLKTMVRQDVLGALALAEGGGFTRTWTRYESSLEVTPGRDFSGFDALISDLQASGIVFSSMAELEDDPERNRQLWELDWRLLTDVPMGMVLSRTPLDVWVRQDIEDPKFCPRLSFVALDPARVDPLTGPYIGMSSLNVQPGGFYTVGMTGTLPAYRGRGIAKALKVRAMRTLQLAGGGTIRTFNDPPNVAMLGMNKALGFERGPDIYRYERDLLGGQP